MAVPEEHLQQTYNPMLVFTFALRAPETKRQWPKRLKVFFDFLDLEDATTIEEQADRFVVKAKQNFKWAHEAFIRFISYQLERIKQGEIAESTLPNYYKAAKLFCEMNDIPLNWNKKRRGIPRAKQAANDRAPTIEEIQKLVEYPDRRIKLIVCIMISSGIRIGAWDYLKLKHVSPITDNGKIVAAKLSVYACDREEYFAFITPEAYNLLKEWMEFRASYGEKITGESWVMRDLWQTTNVKFGFRSGLATVPRKLKSSGIKRLIERALWEQRLRHKLLPNLKRHEWKAAHGFRKYYKTHAEQVMKPINVEITMGHNIGVSASYYKPTEKEVLEDYLKAVGILTITGDKAVLQRQVLELEEKTKNNQYQIDSKLKEKDEIITSTKARYDVDISLLKEAISDMQLLLKNPLRLIVLSKSITQEVS